MDFKSYITAIEKQLKQMTDAQRYDGYMHRRGQLTRIKERNF